MNDIKDCLFVFIDLIGSILKQMFLLYQQFSNFKNQVIAEALGVDPTVVSIIGYIFAGIFVAIFLKKMCSK